MKTLQLFDFASFTKKRACKILNVRLEVIVIAGKQPASEYSRNLQSLLESRHLLKSELPFPDDVIDWHIQKGLIKAEKPIEETTKGFVCKRCGQDHQALFARYPCYACNQQCVYCRSCVMMGRVSECTPLLTWKGGDQSKWPPVRMVWEGILSAGQEKAARSIIEAIRKRRAFNLGGLRIRQNGNFVSGNRICFKPWLESMYSHSENGCGAGACPARKESF